MSRIAIIPARGGSKRIPRKNIRPFLGKPIIAYSIEAALNSGLFDEVMVSTDDEEIASIAKAYGAEVPFLRTIENADDHATLADVLIEVLSQYEILGKNFSEFACILPTAPFIIAERLKEGFVLLNQKNYSTIFPVLRFSYPIQRALELNSKTGNVQLIWPENLDKRSQDLPPAFHDSGQFYCGRVCAMQREKVLFTENSGIIELCEMEVQDIDTENDWKLAELKYKILNELK
jgi:N-acylneuraminate cytidylyltransferase